jgi:predicted metalloprotease
MLQLSDPVGVDGSQDGAHGNGFDRVSAFQEGVEDGAAACAAYESDPPVVTESGFTSQADYASGGDMALEELVPAITDALDGYWSSMSDTTSGGSQLDAPRLVATSGGDACDGASDGGVLVDSVAYCATSNSIVYDPATLREAHASVGDFAAALLLATEWSSAVQHQQGDPITTAEARRTSECMAGAFTGSIDGARRSANGDGITLSPGDLDEVVTMLVATTSDDGREPAFARVSAFRAGFFKGIGTGTMV